jgi:plastocyanin
MKLFNLKNRNLASIIAIMLIFIFSAIAFSGFGDLLQIYSNNSIRVANAQQISDSSTAPGETKITPVTSTNGGVSNTIQLGVTEQQEVYRWSDNNGTINPTLKFVFNSDNTVQIQNPTDEKHEMIVESPQGNELASSGDIEPNVSGELSFRPNMTGTLQYHCEYHPTTMLGTIDVGIIIEIPWNNWHDPPL